MARLRFAYNALSSDNIIGSGASSHVFAINQRLAIKCPKIVDSPDRQWAKSNEENRAAFEREKGFCQKIMQGSHPYFVRYVHIVENGIFMQRMTCTMHARLSSVFDRLCLATQCQWILQLTDALRWLEELGFVHGDLRPANILLDREETVKLSDFNASVELGRQLLVATDPFCKLGAKYELPFASSASEQFALAGTIYNIRYGYEPLHELDPPTRVAALMHGRLPDTGEDYLFGDLIQSLWQGQYASIATAYDSLQLRIHSMRKSSVWIHQDLTEKAHSFRQTEGSFAEELQADVGNFLSTEVYRPA